MKHRVNKRIDNLLLFLFLIISITVCSQKSDFWKRVRFGGGVGLGFGNTTTVSISPTAIYSFAKGFSLGAGLNYTYLESGVHNKANVYGINIISIYNVPLVNLQLSGELEQSFVSQKKNGISSNRGVPAMYLGVGYASRWGSFGFRYDVLHSSNSIYSSAISPVIRVFF